MVLKQLELTRSPRDSGAGLPEDLSASELLLDPSKEVDQMPPPTFPSSIILPPYPELLFMD